MNNQTANRTIPILIVEDSAGDITLLRTALKPKDLDRDLIIVRDGESAIKFAESIDSQPGAVCPHLVVLDLNLPRVNGRDVLKRFRESLRLSTVPIVVLSSSDDERDRVATLGLGATRYLHKPMNLKEFMDIGTTLEALVRSEE